MCIVVENWPLSRREGKRKKLMLCHHVAVIKTENLLYRCRDGC
jgi:hypothetical protein